MVMGLQCCVCEVAPLDHTSLEANCLSLERIILGEHSIAPQHTVCLLFAKCLHYKKRNTSWTLPSDRGSETATGGRQLSYPRWLRETVGCCRAGALVDVQRLRSTADRPPGPWPFRALHIPDYIVLPLPLRIPSAAPACCKRKAWSSGFRRVSSLFFLFSVTSLSRVRVNLRYGIFACCSCSFLLASRVGVKKTYIMADDGGLPATDNYEAPPRMENKRKFDETVGNDEPQVVASYNNGNNGDGGEQVGVGAAAVASYNSVPPPLSEFELAKQKAEQIAARLVGSEVKRPRTEENLDDINGSARSNGSDVDQGYTGRTS